MIIGLTGLSGAGKTTVSDLFAQNGYYVINCDRFVHENVYKDPAVLKRIAETFGTDMVINGELNRAGMRKKVFSSAKETRKLNEFILPIIRDRLDPVLAERKNEKILLDAPTLFQSKMDQACDYTVAVLAEKERLIRRITDRDQLPREEIEERLDRQYAASFFEENCDFVIYNNGSLADLTQEVQLVLLKINEKN